MNNVLLVLADGVGGSAAASTFWNTPIGGWLKAILAAVGVLVVLVAVLKGARKVLDGKGGAAAQIALGAIVLAALCFKPEILSSMIDTAGAIVEKIIASVGQLGK